MIQIQVEMNSAYLISKIHQNWGKGTKKGTEQKNCRHYKRSKFETKFEIKIPIYLRKIIQFHKLFIEFNHIKY